ncbi:hypothetical protein MRB53_035282 [Persea americana]|uniref:Uncharacterized protein n=1 Tax=Persea americana TaxID=3435 RepID=A0ACC2K464_PERAE|nr:hypothetical protein MRB53_035282 [Persea americana]
MLPVCSATASSSSHCQISFQVGPRTLFPLHKSIVEDRVTFGRLNGSRELANISPNQNQFDDIVCGISDDCLEREPQKWRDINGSYPVSDDLHYVETSSISGLDESDSTEVFSNNSYGQSSEGMAVEPLTSSNAELQSGVSPSRGEFPKLSDQLTLSTNVSDSAASESLSTADTGIVLEKATSASDTVDATNDAMSKLKGNLDNFLSGINKSMDTSIGNADTALKNSYDSVTSSFTNAVRSATKSFENATSDVFSSIDNTGDLAGNKLSGLTSDFKENTYKLGNVAINVLRQTIVMVEDSLANAGSFVVYSYGSTKELLPPELQDVLNMYEERAMQVLRPIGTAFQQVYIGIEELEKYLGFDPNDPIVPFILFLGSSATLGISYWAFTYGGYSGDLSPKSTLDLLFKEENVVLIDVRPEDLRERDGIPDLRRGARFKYANITLPEMDGSLRKLLKKGREIDDALVAAVIRNLKIVQDRSKVIVMDASGARSKGIARSLKKLGVMKPYLVQGGYRAWMKNGLRVKELKPETTLTILNEEAEAILEEIRPTPLKIIGYGAGFIASIYALVEWERTLQYIGLFGLGQTIYRRVASYKDAEDLKQDVRLLLTPVSLGAQAFSWAAGKVEPNKIGLPTSPSSTEVQSRVLQAAAKHESQPSDTEEAQDPPLESATPGNENLDLSEA